MATRRSIGMYRICSSPEVNLFTKMRENISQLFSELKSIISEGNRDLHLKFDSRHGQLIKDKQTLFEFRELTEQKLGQNTLNELRNILVREIESEIEKLETESKSKLEVKWDLNDLVIIIKKVDIITMTSSDVNSTEYWENGEELLKQKFPPFREILDSDFMFDLERYLDRRNSEGIQHPTLQTKSKDISEMKFDRFQGDQLIHQGFLTKQGGSIKNWKKRLFTLRTDNILYYYRDIDKDPQGGVDLKEEGVKVRRGMAEDICFKGRVPFDRTIVVDTVGRKYYLYSETVEEADKWLEVLRVAVNPPLEQKKSRTLAEIYHILDQRKWELECKVDALETEYDENNKQIETLLRDSVEIYNRMCYDTMVPGLLCNSVCKFVNKAYKQMSLVLELDCDINAFRGVINMINC